MDNPVYAAPRIGDIVEIQSKIRVKVDKIMYSRELVASDNIVEGLQSYRLDGQKARIILVGEVVT